MSDGSCTFQAIIEKASTTPDGGWRVSFLLSEKDTDIVSHLVKMRGHMLGIGVAYISEESKEEFGEDFLG